MNVLVTGTRAELDADGRALLEGLLAWNAPRTEEGAVYVGDCTTGVDAVARAWCEAHGLRARGGKLLVFEADWDRWGKSAGPRRNQAMVDAARSSGLHTMALAFPSSSSRGTWDCVRRLARAGLAVWVHPVRG